MTSSQFVLALASRLASSCRIREDVLCLCCVVLPFCIFPGRRQVNVRIVPKSASGCYGNGEHSEGPSRNGGRESQLRQDRLSSTTATNTAAWHSNSALQQRNWMVNAVEEVASRQCQRRLQGFRNTSLLQQQRREYIPTRAGHSGPSNTHIQ